MEKPYEQHSIDQARKKVQSSENHKPHTPPSMSTMGDKDYFEKAYPKGYDLKDRVTHEHRIQAADANFNLFKHKAATFFSLEPESVKESSLSDQSKEILTRYAHSAWELRADTDEDSGEVRNYFYLREDVDLSKRSDQKNHEVETV